MPQSRVTEHYFTIEVQTREMASLPGSDCDTEVERVCRRVNSENVVIAIAIPNKTTGTLMMGTRDLQRLVKTRDTMTFAFKMATTRGRGVYLLSHGTKAWEKMNNELKEYRKQHGDCHVPNWCTVNCELGQWVHEQRH